MSNKLENRLNALAVRVANEFINSYGQIGSLSALNSTNKGSLVGAINEALAKIPEGLLFASNNLSDVTDVSAARTSLSVFSQSEVSAAIAAVTLGSLGGLNQAEVDARVATIVGTAPAALDTLQEIATALGEDPNFAATITAALGNKLDYSKEQVLTDAQELQVCVNAGVGNPDVDLVASFETALNA